MKIIQDHPVATEFALQSGKLIQNFGLVELTSYRWIHALSGSDIAVEISHEVPLAKRIDIVLKLLERDTKLSADHKERATRLWKQVRDKGCELRNTVAHGTAALVIAGQDSTGEVKEAGILKMRKWQDTDQMIGIDELKSAVNTTGQIVQALNGLLEKA